MVRYEEFRRNNANLYDCDAFGLKKVKNVYGAVFPESPDNGRVSIMRFGKWDTEAVPKIEDLASCALLMVEIGSMMPKLQILGFTVVMDLSGLSLRQVSHVTPTIANIIVCLMGVGFPIQMNGLHVINYNWVLNTIFYIFKQFMPQSVWKRLYFHGSDLTSLHKYIHPQYLPEDLGGCCRHFVSTEKWLEKIDMYKDDYMVRELRELGFQVKERGFRKKNIN